MRQAGQRTIILLLILLTAVSGIHADTYAGYDIKTSNGFHIRSADNAFRLNLGGYTQMRWHLNYRLKPAAGKDPVTSGFYVNRTRFYMDGEYTPRFHYQFQINIDSEGIFNIWTARLQYDINPRWSIHSGLGKVPQSREVHQLQLPDLRLQCLSLHQNQPVEVLRRSWLPVQRHR